MFKINLHLYSTALKKDPGDEWRKCQEIRQEIVGTSSTRVLQRKSNSPWKMTNRDSLNLKRIETVSVESNQIKQTSKQTPLKACGLD